MQAFDSFLDTIVTKINECELEKHLIFYVFHDFLVFRFFCNLFFIFEFHSSSFVLRGEF
jgi:hypothetical protein